MRLLVVAGALLLAACASAGTHHEDAPDRDQAPASIALRLIGRQALEQGLQFGGTTVGGLSGIDYDPVADLYYLISDDRSVFAPTRFYTARLSIDESRDAARFEDVALQTVVTFRQPDGTPYPVEAADAEAIRYDASTHSLWWTSEGERKIKAGHGGTRSRLVDPFIRRSTLDGRHVGEVPLDAMFHITREARGPRDNLVFEGLTLSLDGRSLWVSMEGPLLQDGPAPTLTDGAWSRISRYERDGGGGGFGWLSAQFAYRIDPIPSAGAVLTLRAQTGISEILATGPTRMLVLERALVIGAGWRIRLFEADWGMATDVQAFDSLVVNDERTTFVPMSKHLVLDFDTLGIPIDNLEGLCFGPTLANGHRTLVLVSDDNFNPAQTTQFLAFEVVPR